VAANEAIAVVINKMSPRVAAAVQWKKITKEPARPGAADLKAMTEAEI